MIRSRWRRSRKWNIVGGIVLAVAVLLAVLSTFQIRTVTVSGNARYTKEELESKIFDTKLSRNTLFCYLNYQFRPHKSIPFVEDYKIVFRSPQKAELIIYEKSVVGYVSYMSSRMYFDKDGIIVESTNEKLPGIPEISGLTFGHIVLHRPLPVEDERIFDEILNLTQLLSMNEIEADRIHFDSGREISLFLDELQVKLGTNEAIAGKLSELRDMIRDYPDLKGTLYLNTYDEANSNPMYRFEQK